jgi:hypothetical protein
VTRLGDNMTGFPAIVARLMKTWRFVYPEQKRVCRVFADLDSVSGRVFLRGRDMRTKPITYDTNVAKCLWCMSEALLEEPHSLIEVAVPTPVGP